MRVMTEEEALARVKLKQVQEIQQEAIGWENSGFPRHQRHVIKYGGQALAASAIACFAMYLQAYKLIKDFQPLVWLVVLGVPIAVTVYAHLTDQSPRSHKAMLDQLLIAYEPISEDAFRQLQSNASRWPLTPKMVIDWAEHELSAVESCILKLNVDDLGFVKKSV